MSHPDPFADPEPRPPVPPPVPPPLVPPAPSAGTRDVDLGEQPDIVPWGPPGSGKTTLLATMLYMLKMRATNKDDKLFYDVFPADDGAREFLGREVADLSRGILPQPTRVGDAAVMTSRSFSVGLRDRERTGLWGRFHRLLLMDAAGEETHPRSNYQNVYWERVRRARGVIMVVNMSDAQKPVDYQDGTTASYRSLIETFLELAREKYHWKPYLAICLTQADRVYTNPEETYQVLTPKEVDEMNRTENEPRERFKQIVGKDTYDYLSNYFGGNGAKAQERFKIFITSATGWYRDPHIGWQPNVEQTPTGWRMRATGDNWWTIGVLYPLMWLFDKIEADRYSEQRKTRRGLIKKYQERLTNQTILKERIALPKDHPYWL